MYSLMCEQMASNCSVAAVGGEMGGAMGGAIVIMHEHLPLSLV